jgi:hypothetical protein
VGTRGNHIKVATRKAPRRVVVSGLSSGWIAYVVKQYKLYFGELVVSSRSGHGRTTVPSQCIDTDEVERRINVEVTNQAGAAFKIQYLGSYGT